MRKKALVAAIMLNGILGTASFGEEEKKEGKKEKKKVEGHCEKVANGEHTDLEPPADEENPKKWCKEQGGKWQKGKKHTD